MNYSVLVQSHLSFIKMVRLDKEEPIAIIGTACRLPGDSNSVDSLWDMISNSRTGHGKIPSDRWDADKWYHPDPDRKGGVSPYS